MESVRLTCAKPAGEAASDSLLTQVIRLKTKRGKLCEQEGCNKFRHFGHKNDGRMRFCGAHKESGMLNLSRKVCEFGDCVRPATHGSPTPQRKKVYCQTHQKQGMVNLALRICLHPGCGKSANYKGGADGKVIFCTTHKEGVKGGNAEPPGMGENAAALNAAARIAQTPTVSICAEPSGHSPAHDSSDIGSPPSLLQHAAHHRLKENWPAPQGILLNDPARPLQFQPRPLNFLQSPCGTTSTVTKPHHATERVPTSTNRPGGASTEKNGNEPITCPAVGCCDDAQRHKTGRHCEQEGCEKFKHFGHKSEGTIRYCGVHKQPGMVNLSRKTCEMEGCTRPASHGYENLRKKVFCLTHKMENMINLALQRCLYPGCNTSANYKSSDGRRLYCSKHKGRGEVPQPVAADDAGVHMPAPAMADNAPAIDKKEQKCHPISSEGMPTAPPLPPERLLQAGPLPVHHPVNYFSVPFEVLVPILVQPPMVPMYLPVPSQIPQFHPSLFQFPHLFAHSSAATLPLDSIKYKEDVEKSAEESLPQTSSEAVAAAAAAESPPTPPKRLKTTRGKLCEQKGCEKFRHFGHPNRGLRFCGAHKEAGMVNLSRKACEFEGCTRPATHGCPTTRKKVYCPIHQKEGMVNLVLRVCLHPGCGKSANYKGSADGKVLYCTTHKGVRGSKARQRKQTASVYASGMSATSDSGGRLSTTITATEGTEQDQVAVDEHVLEDKLPLDSTKDGTLLVTTTTSLGYNKRQCDDAAEGLAFPSCAGRGNPPFKKRKKVATTDNEADFLINSDEEHSSSGQSTKEWAGWRSLYRPRWIHEKQEQEEGK